MCSKCNVYGQHKNHSFILISDFLSKDELYISSLFPQSTLSGDGDSIKNALKKVKKKIKDMYNFIFSEFKKTLTVNTE